jgi:predicted DNA-binding protein with PD1-like motif
MQYSEGSIGRVFIIRMDDGEDVIESIQKLIEEKEIESGFMLFLGALLKGRAVTGPEEPVIPPLPHFVSFDGGWEVFGMATIYQSGAGPQIHIHSSIGRGREALVGCIRGRASVYLTVEAILIEIKCPGSRKELDERMGLQLLKLDRIL